MLQRHLRERHPTQTEERVVWERFSSQEVVSFRAEWVVGAEDGVALLEDVGYWGVPFRVHSNLSCLKLC